MNKRVTIQFADFIKSRIISLYVFSILCEWLCIRKFYII